MIRNTINSLRRLLRSVRIVRATLLYVEDLIFPRHPQREHPVIPLSECFPNSERINLRHLPPKRMPLAEELPCAPEATHLTNPIYTPPVTYGAILPNALFCPFNNVVLTENRSVVAESVGPTHCMETMYRRPLSEERIEAISGYATALRSHYRNHYEALIDNLPRLALLHESPFSEFSEIKVLYTGDLTPMEAHLLPHLLPLNAVLHRIASNRKIYQVESYVLSTFLTQCYGSYLPDYYVTWFRERVLPKRPSRRNRRLLISRADAPTRRLLNHGELQEALKGYGFETLTLESLSPQEQIEAFYDAEVIVAPHGAGLANLCFATDARVLELFSIPSVRPCYYYLSEALGHRYTYCLPARSLGPNVFADFEVDVAVVVDRLNNLLGVDSPKRGNPNFDENPNVQERARQSLRDAE